MAVRRSGRQQQQQQLLPPRRLGRGGRGGRGVRGGRGRRGFGGPYRGGAPPATAEGLDAQLEAYMGDDVVRQRLDRDLDSYFSNSATESAAAVAAATAPATEADVGPTAMEVSIETSAL